MTYERLWERLLTSLDEWADVRAVTDDRIELVVPGHRGLEQTIELVMTPSEWDELVTIPWGDFDLAVEDLKRSTQHLDRAVRYLVYQNYELVPSSEPTLPEDLETVMLRELARRHPEGFGGWYAVDRDGNVIDELGPPHDF